MGLTKFNQPAHDHDSHCNKAYSVCVVAGIDAVLICGAIDAVVDEFLLALCEQRHDVEYSNRHRESKMPSDDPGVACDKGPLANY